MHDRMFSSTDYVHITSKFQQFTARVLVQAMGRTMYLMKTRRSCHAMVATLFKNGTLLTS
jgi:hypothetical protein